jgi:hypothetical protein
MSNRLCGSKAPQALRLKTSTDPDESHPVTLKPRTPSLEKEVYLVGELPDWLVVGLENAKAGDGPK